MPSTPWVIRRTRRPRSAATPASRERTNSPGGIDSANPAQNRSKDQSTLTQTQWIGSACASPADRSDMPELEDREFREGWTKKQKSSKRSKRNSTLTQMDWLGNFQIHNDGDPADMQMLSELDVSAQADILRTDGTHDNGRKPKKRKSDTLKEALLDFSPTGKQRDTEDRIPTKRRKKESIKSNVSEDSRRRSARTASKILIDSGQQSTNPAVSTQDDLSATPKDQKAPVLEIMESLEPENEHTFDQGKISPHTPRRRLEVPSSQTPETVTRTRRRHHRDVDTSPSKGPGRTPLREKSTNIGPKAYLQDSKASQSLTSHAKASTKRSKICVLKVPRRDLLQRSKRIGNQSSDIYSLHGTSSADEVGLYQSHKDSKRPPASSKKTEEGSIEIPSTGQRNSSSDRELPSSPPVVEMDESIPDLEQLLTVKKFNSPTKIPKVNDSACVIDIVSGDQSAMVKNFGQPTSEGSDEPEHDNAKQLVETETSLDDVMLLDHEEAPMIGDSAIMAAARDDQDQDSEFDFPIANDTQFNAGLIERTSSPNLDPISTRDNHSATTERAKQGCLPTVRRNERSKPQRGDGGLSDPTEGKSRDNVPPTVHESHNHQTTTKIQLNDTLPTLPLSSPSLPPVKSITQRSIHPASIPRPSQISTQDPTQYYHLSSIPNYTQYHDMPEIITIKESDSIVLSQIPQYESQNQGSNVNVLNDLDDDDEDLDLDPSSTYNRQSARKPSALRRKETGSSLRSIHTTSTGYYGDKKRELLPSSPLSQASALHQKPEINGAHARSDTDHKGKKRSTNKDGEMDDLDLSSSPLPSSPSLQPLKENYEPLPGFDNDTQSNFTQNGHVTAAYVRRQQETGAWPDWFVPEPFQISNWKKPAHEEGSRGGSSRKRKA